MAARNSTIFVLGSTYSIVIRLQHLYVVILWKAVLADGGEVCSLPTRAVEILLDLGRHFEQLPYEI